MVHVMHGIVHGKTIEFPHEVGVPEGQEVEVVIRLGGASLPANGARRQEWTDEMNARRCSLIDKDVRGAITSIEAIELEDLQEQLRRHRRLVAPLPLAETRRMLEELERKAQAST